MDSSPLGSTAIGQTPDVSSPQQDFPPWARFAGLASIFIGLTSLLCMGINPDASNSRGAFGIGITVVISVLLVQRSHAVLPLARLRAWLGVILGIPLMFAIGGSIEAAFQAIFATSLILLLGEKPGRLRVRMGVVLMVLAMGLSGLSSLALVFPSYATQLTYLGKTDPIIDRTVQGSGYRVRVPDSRWALIKPEIVRTENQAFDRWIVCPALDLHVAVLTQEDTGVSLSEFEHQVTEQLNSIGAKLVSREQHRLGTILHLSAGKDAEAVEMLQLLVARPRRLYQVHCWSTPHQWPVADVQFRKVFDEFEPESKQP